MYLYKSRVENRLKNKSLALTYAYIYLTKTSDSRSQEIAERHIKSLLKNIESNESKILMKTSEYKHESK